MKELRDAGAEKIFRETASGAKSDRAQLRRAPAQIDADDVLLTPCLDRLARSTQRLGGDRRQGRALAFARGRMGGRRHGARVPILTVRGGLAEVERDLIRTDAGEAAGAVGRTA
jgi:hypothetical protein